MGIIIYWLLFKIFILTIGAVEVEVVVIEEAAVIEEAEVVEKVLGEEAGVVVASLVLEAHAIRHTRLQLMILDLDHLMEVLMFKSCFSIKIYWIVLNFRFFFIL